MESLDCVVLGAGVIGLAIAREFASRGREVVILEASTAIGSGTSSRNSEVIHAGIYYPQGTLKARLCVEGRDLLYEYCRDRHIEHRQIGKLIVAADEEQVIGLNALHDQARRNGVSNLSVCSPLQVAALEPAVRCTAALYSPLTGIIDSHGLMLSLLGDAEAAGAMVAFNTPVVGGCARDTIVVRTGGVYPMELRAKTLINATGLSASDVASRLDGPSSALAPGTWFAKGNYYSLANSPNPFRRLIYPIPGRDGLGIHVTLDLAGRARFGPDVQWIDELDYTVDPSRSARFYEFIRRYWPDIPDDSLQPDYAGIRPKIAPPGSPSSDFVVQGTAAHGVAGLVNLFGIESPGLTACLALARHVAAIV